MEANKAAVRRFPEEFLSCGDPSVADQVLVPVSRTTTRQTPTCPGARSSSGRSATGVLPFQTPARL